MRLVSLVGEQPHISERFFIAASGEAIRVELEDPGRARAVSRLKQNALKPDATHLKPLSLPGRPGVTLSYIDLMKRYVGHVARVGAAHEGSPRRCWLALPAVREPAIRLEYFRALEGGIHAELGRRVEPRFITEPDAVIQYFRLVKRQIVQASNKVEAYLVLDSGATTTNIAIVFKAKTVQGVTTLAKGKSTRAGPLKPVEAAAPFVAGDWVDAELVSRFLSAARAAGVDVKDASDDVVRGWVRDEIQDIKEAISGDPDFEFTFDPMPHLAAVPGAVAGVVRLSRADLDEVIRQMWVQLGTQLGSIFERTYQQFLDSPIYRSCLDDWGIRRSDEVPRMFRYVVLAGGTSQLPRFRDHLQRALGEVDDGCEFLSVGSDYRYAVAAGLAAHALESTVRVAIEHEEVAPAADSRVEEPLADDTSAVEEPESGAAETEKPEWLTSLLERQGDGIQRLTADVALVFRVSGQEKVYVRRVFDANVFPMAYELTEEQLVDGFGSDGHAVKFDVPLDRDKRSRNLEFSLCYLAEATGEVNAPAAGQLQLGHERWVRVEQSQFRTKHVRAVPSYDATTHALRVDLYQYHRTRADQPHSIAHILAPLHRDDDPEQYGHLLRWWAREQRSLRARSPKRPVAPSPEPVAKAVPTTEVTAPTSSKEGPDLCFDFGTSKTVCVAAIPPLDLLGVDGRPMREVAATSLQLPRQVREGRSGRQDQTDAPTTPPATTDAQAGLTVVEGSKPPALRDVPVPSPAGQVPAAAARELAVPAPASEVTDAKSDEPRAEVVPPAGATSSMPPAEVAHPEADFGGRVESSDVDWTACVGASRPPRQEEFRDSEISERQLLLQIYDQIKNRAGLEVELADLVNLHLSLKVSPLVVLAGPPGVGKSSLARLYAMALGASVDRGSLCRVAVEARWTGPEFLYGRGDGAHWRPSRFLELAWRAQREDRAHELFFALLDEANLAQLDYYFSDVVSAMSDDGEVHVPLAGARGLRDLRLPIVAPNHRLCFVGTMNVDEAATTLTDKVLDRTSVIELPLDCIPSSMHRFINEEEVRGSPILRASDWARHCQFHERIITLPTEVQDLWRCLRFGATEGADAPSPQRSYLGHRLAFGIRTARDIATYLSFAERLSAATSESDSFDFPMALALDHQVCQRVLPRLRGGPESRGVLEDLAGFCDRQQLHRARERVDRMLFQLEHHLTFNFWSS